MSKPALSIEHAYQDAQRLASERFPYRFGGGHNRLFMPSAGEPPGYDCSGWCSVILHDAGLLGTPAPLGTHELARWGAPGEGEHMTLWVINEHELEHCFLEFRMPGHPPQFSRGAHTGTVCGWSPFPLVTAGYSPRRRP